jgi:hypothetical protein
MDGIKWSELDSNLSRENVEPVLDYSPLEMFVCATDIFATEISGVITDYSYKGTPAYKWAKTIID